MIAIYKKEGEHALFVFVFVTYNTCILDLKIKANFCLQMIYNYLEVINLEPV